MQEIYDFVRVYWKVILSVILFIVGFVLALVRKKPVSDIASLLYTWCIEAIKLVENSNTEGSRSKLNLAIKIVKTYFDLYYPNANFSLYEKTVENYIELILSTPQKKGD